MRQRISSQHYVVMLCVTEERCFMAAHWSNKRQTRVGSKYIGVTFVNPNCWMDDWNFNRDGLHIN
jgi:hypothetical protein